MFSFLFDLVVFGAGLVVAWNFWPQPAVVKTQVDAVVAAVSKKLNG
jgi:hypothetical protein